VALENQPFFKAPSVPKIGRRTISSSVFSSAAAATPKLKTSSFNFIQPQQTQATSQTQALQAEVKQTNKNTEIVNSTLIETNRILVEIQKQLSLDFAARQTEKKQALSASKASVYKQRISAKERGIEAANKIRGGILKAFNKVTAPAKSIFDKIVEFFSIILTGILVNTAWKWLQDPGNREKVGKFFGFIAEHWRWIVRVLVVGKLLGFLYKIYRVGKGIKKLLDLIPKPPYGRGGGPKGGGPGPRGGGPQGPAPGSPDFCKGVYACIAGSVAQYVKLFTPYFAPKQVPAPPVGGPVRPPIPVSPIFQPSPTQPITPRQPTNKPQTPWYNTPLAQTLGYGALGLGLGALTAAAFISPFEGPAGDIAAGTATAGAFGRASGAFRTLSGGGRNIPKRPINPISTTLRNIPGSPTDVLRSPTLTNKFLKFLKQNPAFKRSGSDPSRLKSIEDFASFTGTTAENLVKSQFKNFVEYLKSPAGVRLSQGGTVGGSGPGTIDSVPAMLAPGEEVIRTSSAMLFRPLLKDINDNAGRLWNAFQDAIGRQEQNNAIQLGITKRFTNLLTQFNNELKGLIQKEKLKELKKNPNLFGQVSNIPPQEGTGKGGPSDISQTPTIKPPATKGSDQQTSSNKFVEPVSGPPQSQNIAQSAQPTSEVASVNITPTSPVTPNTQPAIQPLVESTPSITPVAQKSSTSIDDSISRLIQPKVKTTQNPVQAYRKPQRRSSMVPFQMPPINLASNKQMAVPEPSMGSATDVPAIPSFDLTNPYIMSSPQEYGILAT
jgi:hypothetical protein